MDETHVRTLRVWRFFQKSSAARKSILPIPLPAFPGITPILTRHPKPRFNARLTVIQPTILPSSSATKLILSQSSLIVYRIKFSVYSAGLGASVSNAAFSVGFAKDGSIRKVKNERRVSGNAPEPNAAWSLYSYSAEYARFLCAMINDKGGLSDAAFSEMTRAQNKADDNIHWGLGFGIYFLSQHQL